MSLSSKQITILFGAIAAILILVVAVWFGVLPKKSSVPILVFWSPRDSTDVFSGLLAQYSQQTGVTVKFVQRDPATYEQDLVNALASGQGPDIFVIQNTWLLKHLTKLYPAPSDLLTGNTVGNYYPEVVSRDFVYSNMVYALPLSVDSLTLFYNRKLFDQAGIVFPPKTWEELLVDIPKLAKVNRSGIITRAAVALGTSNNVPHAPDVLSLLMMQSGATMVDATTLEVNFQKASNGTTTSPGSEALQFYARFSTSNDPIYTWNSDQPSAIDAFSQGNLAMFFGYADDIPGIRSRAPYLDFKVAPMPQPAAAQLRTDYAGYPGYAVSRTSRNPRAAWQFITWLTQLTQARTYMRAANRPPARRELINEVADDPILGVFGQEALTAQSWYQPDPDVVDSIFTTMVDDVNYGRHTPDEAVSQAADQINLLFQKTGQ